MAQTKSKSCDKFDSFRIANIKNIIWGRSYELSIFSLKTEMLLEFLRLGSKLFHSIKADGKKIIFEKVMLCLNKGNIAFSSGSI